MTKYVITNEVPTQLSTYEIRIDPPTLVNEVNNCWAYRPANGLTGVHWLRQIASEICKWDSGFNPMRHIVPTDYQGVPFANPEEVAKLVLNMVTDRYKGLMDAWVEHNIRHKPPFTKLIWFTGTFSESSKFASNFVDRIDISEVAEYIEKERKKQKLPASNTQELTPELNKEIAQPVEKAISAKSIEDTLIDEISPESNPVLVDTEPEESSTKLKLKKKLK